MSRLDVIIRMHDPARLDELNRAVFSAALQDMPSVTIHVVCQRFTAPDLKAVRRCLAPIMALAPGTTLQVHNRVDPLPCDARAALLNLGIAAAHRTPGGRYLAFLDYDDLIYPEGWRLLAAELEATGAAIAFGAVLNATVSRHGLVPLVTAKQHIFHGDGLRQLLHSNFCPLHSFLIDCTRLPPGLVFDETLTALEDYDFLLRVVSHCPSSFRLKDKPIGEYLLKDDGSNMNPMARSSHPASSTPSTWAAAIAAVDARKRHMVLSQAVQTQLGIDRPGLTVAGLLTGVSDPRPQATASGGAGLSSTG